VNSKARRSGAALPAALIAGDNLGLLHWLEVVGLWLKVPAARIVLM